MQTNMEFRNKPKHKQTFGSHRQWGKDYSVSGGGSIDEPLGKRTKAGSLLD